MPRKKVETVEKQEAAKEKTLTRAQKTEATKAIIKELLAVKPMRHNELIEEVAKEYNHRHEGDAAENMNDVKGRVGSVLDIMKKVSEVGYDGGMYALKARIPVVAPSSTTEEKAPAKKTVRAKKEETPKAEETASPAPKKRGRPKKALAETAEKKDMEETPREVEKVEKKAERVNKVVTPEVPTPSVEEKKEEKAPTVPVSPPAPAPAPSPLPTPVPVPEKSEVKGELVVPPKAEVAKKSEVMDMSFLFGVKPQKTPSTVQKPTDTKVEPEKKVASVPSKAEAEKAETPSKLEKLEEKVSEETAPVTPKTVAPVTPKTVAPVVPKKTTGKPAQKAEAKPPQREVKRLRVVKAKPQTADEKLKESFLKRLRTLGGDYFEYYSVYLLERYSMKNGRRLEGLKISGGDHDGGIDGEIELTDKLGFKETIYIQSKNWDPEKGKEENWIVGETLLQQFIGACACRQAKEGKQHTRGIFITTSRYTPDAKRILEDMSDKIIGYDGNDLYEAAKECEFGLIKKNGEWALDEKLLSGPKAFFQMY